jgi:hypothetical protein
MVDVLLAIVFPLLAADIYRSGIDRAVFDLRRVFDEIYSPLSWKESSKETQSGCLQRLHTMPLITGPSPLLVAM